MTRQDQWEHIAFRTGRSLLGVLPSETGVALLRGLARGGGAWPGLRRRLVQEQLAAVYPDLTPGECRALADAVYDHLARTVVEVFREDPEQLQQSVRLESGWRILDRAMAAGRGAIVATAHLGNFELGGRVLAARHPLLDVVKPQRNPRFEVELQRLRRRHGISTVPVDGSGRAVLRHLADGGLVSLFVDQDAGAAGLPMDFLGLPASTWPGAARIALRTGCPVVPMAIVREKEGHVLRMAEAIEVAPADPDPRRVQALMERISASVERFIREHPEQWFWVHRRWKGAASDRRKSGVQEPACEA